MKKSSFEKDLKQIENIALKLENGEIELEEAVNLYTDGVALCEKCFKTLENAKLRIEEITVKNEQ